MNLVQDLPIRILVLPIFRRYWCFHAIEDVKAAERVVSQVSSIDWRKGANVEEKLSLLGTKIGTSVHSRILKQWRDLEAAGEGTIKNRVFRLAQAVLSGEDSDETFLKAVPQSVSDVEIVYPSSWKETVVRRRLRLLLKYSAAKSRRRLAVWGTITVPLVPLLATPLPAFPVYYTAWKAYSNYKALAGAKALNDCWSVRDTAVLVKLQRELGELEQAGVKFPVDSWPAKLLSNSPRYLDILENPEAKVMRFYRRLEPTSIVPRMTPSQDLDALVRPLDRSSSPLADEAVVSIAKQFDAPALLEHVARARKQATGAMFPKQM